MNGVNFKDLAVDLRKQLDAQRLRADTAEAELQALRLVFENAEDCELNDAELKLAAAEQRIAELSANNQLLRKLLEQTLAALNPSAKLSKSIRAALSTASPATINQQGEEA